MALLSMMRHQPVLWEETAKRPVSLPLQLHKAGLEEEFRQDKQSSYKLSASFYFTRTRRIKEPGKTEAKGYKIRPPPSGTMRFYWCACQCCKVHTLKSLGHSAGHGKCLLLGTAEPLKGCQTPRVSLTLRAARASLGAHLGTWLSPPGPFLQFGSSLAP